MEWSAFSANLSSLPDCASASIFSSHCRESNSRKQLRNSARFPWIHFPDFAFYVFDVSHDNLEQAGRFWNLGGLGRFPSFRVPEKGSRSKEQGARPTPSGLQRPSGPGSGAGMTLGVSLRFTE